MSTRHLKTPSKTFANSCCKLDMHSSKLSPQTWPSNSHKNLVKTCTATAWQQTVLSTVSAGAGAELYIFGNINCELLECGYPILISVSDASMPHRKTKRANFLAIGKRNFVFWTNKYVWAADRWIAKSCQKVNWFASHIIFLHFDCLWRGRRAN